MVDAEPEDLKWSPRTISVAGALATGPSRTRSKMFLQPLKGSLVDYKVLPCAEERDLAAT